MQTTFTAFPATSPWIPHIRVFDCISQQGHGIAIGSEMSGGVNDVKIWNCDIKASLLGLNIKGTEHRGGYIKNVSCRRMKAYV